MARGTGPLEISTRRSRRERAGLRRSDFLRASDSGKRLSSRYFLVFGLKRGDSGPARLGITVTRKVGNAVRRNRIKRLVREWFRQRRESIADLDLVVIVKRGFPERATQSDVNTDLDSALGPDCSRLLP